MAIYIIIFYLKKKKIFKITKFKFTAYSLSLIVNNKMLFIFFSFNIFKIVVI